MHVLFDNCASASPAMLHVKTPSPARAFDILRENGLVDGKTWWPLSHPGAKMPVMPLMQTWFFDTAWTAIQTFVPETS